MASRRRLRRVAERRCAHKTTYETRDDAEWAARWTIETTHVRPYRCRYCAGWHLGHERAVGKRDAVALS